MAIKSPVLANLGLAQAEENSVTLVASNFIPETLGRVFFIGQWISKEEVKVTAYAMGGKHFIKMFSKSVPHANFLTAMINARGGYNVSNWDVYHFATLNEAMAQITNILADDMVKLGATKEMLVNVPMLRWYDGMLITASHDCKTCIKSFFCGGTCAHKRSPNEHYLEFNIGEDESPYLTLKSTPVENKEMICVSKKSMDGMIIARLYVKVENTKQVYKDFTGTPDEFSNYLKEFSARFLEPKGAKWISGD